MWIISIKYTGISLKNLQTLCSIKKVFCLLLSAPGSYDIEKAEKKVHQASSAYSFGVKYKDQKLDDVPGKWKIYLTQHALFDCIFHDRRDTMFK